MADIRPVNELEGSLDDVTSMTTDEPGLSWRTIGLAVLLGAIGWIVVGVFIWELYRAWSSIF